MVKLHPYQDLSQYAQPWLTSEPNVARAEQAFAAIYDVHFGYSDRQLDMQGMIPTVFEICMPLVKDFEDFLRLCQAVPDLIRSLPEESEDTPIGYCHYYDTSGLRERVQAAHSLDEFLLPAQV